jgi:hypothetical protein
MKSSLVDSERAEQPKIIKSQTVAARKKEVTPSSKNDNKKLEKFKESIL